MAFSPAPGSVRVARNRKGLDEPLQEVPIVIGGVAQVAIEVEDQERAKAFWTQTLGFELAQDAPYGEERWLEVRAPDGAVTIVLSLRQGERPAAPEGLPTSNIMFYCDDLARTYEELTA